MLYFPVKSPLNSAKPPRFNTYKLRKNNPLHFQHLQNLSHLFIPEPLQLPFLSTLTRTLLLTPAESTLAKKGVGAIMVNCTSDEGRASRATIGSRGTSLPSDDACPSVTTLAFAPSASDLRHSCLGLVYPESFSRGALSLPRAKRISHISNHLRTLASLLCRLVQVISFFLNGLRTLCKNTGGVPQLLFTPKALSAGPICHAARAISRSTHSMIDSLSQTVSQAGNSASPKAPDQLVCHLQLKTFNLQLVLP